MTMEATVLQASSGRWGTELLVRDASNQQEVLVHTSYSARCFSAGNRILIQFDGAMTPSLPPQISASGICMLSY
ncbi:MAG: hypothetical protein HFF18_09000 [Oscillospiraceae bacterium]|nr:hypothetical protein [Oscillospiraceae bacterium]